MDSQTVKLKNVRLFFPCLFTPESFKKEEGKEKKFSARLGILKTDTAQLGLLNAARNASLLAVFGDKWQVVLAQMKAENRVCITDGDVKDTEGFEGQYILSTSRREKDGPPLILDRSRIKLEKDTGVLYSGCYVNAIVRFWAQNNSWGKRSNCALQGIQFCADGEAFAGGGGRSSPDDFDAVESTTSLTDAESFL